MKMMLLIIGLSALLSLYKNKGYWSYLLSGLFVIMFWRYQGVEWVHAYQAVLVLFIISAVIFGLRNLRTKVLSRFIMPLFAKALPRISETESAALEAGGTWWDAELFSGNPQWQKLLDLNLPGLSQRERDFLNGPANNFCKIANDWEMRQERDLSKAGWDYVKKERFFGMIIGEKDGGLGFSAAANAAVVARIASRSVSGAVTVMVPNSLGPGELLLHYGTEAQKQYYLPRLARGEEIPCFALTEPEAGSDAASLQSYGIVCKGKYEGKEVLGIRLNWDKRYTTLGPIATVLGLAFQLYDPEQLLGDKKDLGITCALIPTNLAGITIGERHDPLGCPFLNGPNHGKDVFVPIDCVIGGPKMVGRGWRMLMDCLTVGRSISLPAVASAETQLATRVASAYALLREQFNMPIGRFEGIEMPLARIGGLNYIMLAARRVTLGAIDCGHKAAVISAIMKAYCTEALRVTMNDAMDILGGAGISLGPRNTIGHPFATVPITITVEGANILTRTMIIFGQGAIRCHPFVQSEIKAVENNDLAAFDKAFFGHVNFTAGNAARSFVRGLTRGLLVGKPKGLKSGSAASCFAKELSRLSSAFALLADAAMAVLGGELKRRERLCGRYADALAWLYFASTCIKKYHDDNEPKDERPFFKWACAHALYQVQEAMRGILDNFPNVFVRQALRLLVFPSGAYLRPPQDKWVGKMAHALLYDGALRERFTPDLYMPDANEPGLGELEAAWRMMIKVQPTENKIKEAVKAKKIPKGDRRQLLDAAISGNIITAQERQELEAARAKRLDVLQVDSFSAKDYLQMRS